MSNENKNESKTKAARLQVNEDLRRFTKMALKSYGFEHVIESDSVTLKLDDVCQLVGSIMEQHNRVHLIQNRLRKLFPVIELFEAIDTSCEEFHTRLPISDEMMELMAELEKRESQKAARDTVRSFLEFLQNNAECVEVVSPEASVAPEEMN